MFECPVCSYEGLTVVPYERWPPPPDVFLVPSYEEALGRPSYEVCPRCGFEFGNDDNPGTAEPQSFDDYRREWQGQGRPWFSRAAELADLQERVSSSEISVDETNDSFERLTKTLESVTPRDDARLRELVNEMELIRFTLLPQNQRDALLGVLQQAKPLFERRG